MTPAVGTSSLSILPLARIATLSLALGASVLAGCDESRSAVNDAAKPPEVGVVTLATQPLALSTELSGRTSAYMVAQIRPQVGGIIQQRAFTEGALVKAGELLYQIDPASYRAAHASAKASVARAEATLNAARLKARRQAELLAIEAISKQDEEDAQASLQQAEADLASARAALATASIDLERTRITSPIGGRIEASSVTPGALVTANQETALTTVQQLDPIYVDIPQSSAEVLQLRKALAAGTLQSDADNAARIRLILEDDSVYPHEGKLQFSGVTVNTGTGAVTLRALVPNPERLLLPGMYVRVTLGLGEDPAAILVPQRAVQRGADGLAHVLVLDENDIVQSQKVSTGAMYGSDWHITEGHKENARVVVGGLAAAVPGTKVQIRAAAAAEAGVVKDSEATSKK